MTWFFGIECKLIGRGYAAHGLADYIIGSLLPGGRVVMKARGHRRPNVALGFPRYTSVLPTITDFCIVFKVIVCLYWHSAFPSATKWMSLLDRPFFHWRSRQWERLGRFF